MAIYVSGSLAFDRIMLMPGKFVDHILPEKLHILSVSFLIDKIVEKRGGTAGNIAYSMHLLGQKATILASVGRVGSKLSLAANFLKRPSILTPICW